MERFAFWNETEVQILVVPVAVTHVGVAEDVEGAGGGAFIEEEFGQGGGGGQPFMATAGGKDISKIDDAISFAKAEIEKVL